MRTIDDVRGYTSKLAGEFPSLASEVEITPEAGCLSNDVIAKLDLPGSYVDVANQNRLAGVSLGFFSLWPAFSIAPLNESLLGSNSEESEIRRFGKDELITVARFEANPICVGAATSAFPGHVYALDTMSSPDWQLLDVADSFETFVILAANVRMFADLFDGDVDGAGDAMRACAQDLRCNTGQAEFWVRRTEEMVA